MGIHLKYTKCINKRCIIMWLNINLKSINHIIIYHIYIYLYGFIIDLLIVVIIIIIIIIREKL